MKKYREWYGKIGLKSPKCLTYRIYFRFDLFNPFAKRQPGCIVPIINLLPQIGIGIDRETRYAAFHVGWLNFLCELHFFFYIDIDTSKIRINKERA